MLIDIDLMVVPFVSTRQASVVLAAAAAVVDSAVDVEVVSNTEIDISTSSDQLIGGYGGGRGGGGYGGGNNILALTSLSFLAKHT